MMEASLKSTSARTKKEKQKKFTTNHCKVCVIQKRKRVSY